MNILRVEGRINSLIQKSKRADSTACWKLQPMLLIRNHSTGITPGAMSAHGT